MTQLVNIENLFSSLYSLSGTTTNNMLDAIIPTARYQTSNSGAGVSGYSTSSINAYLDSTAKTVGYAYLNNIVAEFDGTYWKPLGNNTKVLSGDFKVQVSATDIGGVAGNGLIYTGTNVPFNTTYRIDSEFGVASWSNATCNSVNPRWNSSNICRDRQMLLPTYSETQITSSNLHNPCGGTGNTNGVPSHPYGHTWTLTSTAHYLSPSTYWIWRSTTSNANAYSHSTYVRCVR